MKIIYRNGFRDRIAFVAYHCPRNPIFIFMMLGAFLFFTFESVIPALHSLPADRSIFFKLILFVITELVIAVAIVGVWTVIMLATMISPKNKTLYCERAMTVGDDAFVIESEYGRSETNWSVIQKLARTRTHIFMYVNQENAVTVPRRAFESATQWDTFYEICRRSTARGA